MASSSERPEIIQFMPATLKVEHEPFAHGTDFETIYEQQIREHVQPFQNTLSRILQIPLADTRLLLTNEYLAYCRITTAEESIFAQTAIYDLFKKSVRGKRDPLWETLLKIYLDKTTEIDFQKIKTPGKYTIQALKFALFLATQDEHEEEMTILKILFDFFKNQQGEIYFMTYPELPELQSLLQRQLHNLCPILDEQGANNNYDGYGAGDWIQAQRAFKMIVWFGDGSFIPLLDLLRKDIQAEYVFFKVARTNPDELIREQRHHLITIENTIDRIQKLPKFAGDDTLETELRRFIKQFTKSPFEIKVTIPEKLQVGRPDKILVAVTPVQAEEIGSFQKILNQIQFELSMSSLTTLSAKDERFLSTTDSLPYPDEHLSKTKLEEISLTFSIPIIGLRTSLTEVSVSFLDLTTHCFDFHIFTRYIEIVE